MNKAPLFQLGQVVTTRGVLEVITDLTMKRALVRHQAGDWGDICPDDHAENQLSLEHGFRLMSVYEYEGQPKFWIITEADRSATTILLPEEY